MIPSDQNQIQLQHMPLNLGFDGSSVRAIVPRVPTRERVGDGQG